MAELVTIACKLPHGLVIEVGLAQPAGMWGAPIQTKAYRKATLNGTHAEWMKKAPNIQPVATLNPEPGLTQIPKDLWEEWISEGNMGYAYPGRLNGLIWVVPKDKGEARDIEQAAKYLKTGFEPLDPDALPEGVLEAPVQNRPQLGKTPVRRD